VARNEFDGIQTLLIDGNNLMHRLSGSADPGALRTLIARLRGILPPPIDTVLMLDGHADSGSSRSEKIARGFEIRHSGAISADDAIVRLIDGHPRGARSSVTVVSDDRALRDRATHSGAHVERLDWLEGLMKKPEGASGAIGAGRPPSTQKAPAPPVESGDNGEDRRPWSPGRGATKKRGNPRRRPR